MTSSDQCVRGVHGTIAEFGQSAPAAMDHYLDVIVAVTGCSLDQAGQVETLMRAIEAERGGSLDSMPLSRFRQLARVELQAYLAAQA